MARKNDTVPFAAIVLGALASGVMSLLEFLNAHWNVVLGVSGLAVFVVLGVPALVRMNEGGSSRALREHSATGNTHVALTEEPAGAPPEPEPESDIDSDEIGDDPYGILRAVREGRLDEARSALQKIAYGMVGPNVAQAEKDGFRKLMTAFAADDPLMQQALPMLLDLIRSQPGLQQSKIYASAAQWDVETVRYVLYFAEQLGAVRRVKHGSSYRLYAPDEQRRWVALTAQFRCAHCGTSAGGALPRADTMPPPSCSTCGAPMDRVLCRHVFVAPRSGREANNPNAMRCIDCGSYVTPEGPGALPTIGLH